MGVHRVLGPLAAPRSARGLEGLGLAAPLVGRERELRRMDAAFDDMRAGRAQVLSLIGEPGAGKSRLQREFFARLEAAGHLEGATIRRAACSALGEQTYGAVAALLRDAYGVEHGDSVDVTRSKLAAGLETLGVDAEERAAMVAALARVFGLEQDDARIRHLEPEQLKRQIFMATYVLVERRLAGGPLVLVVEDLHWADAASIELIGAVADRLADRPLLVLLMYRPTLEPDALGTSRTPHTAIEVTPLSRSGSEDLLAAWFGDSTHLFPERLRAQILERAGGNPLYLEEVVRALLVAGVLVRDGEAWRCTAEAATAQVPATLHGLLLARAGPARRRGAAGHPGSGGDRTPLRGVAAEGGLGGARRGGRGARRARRRRSGDAGAGSPVPPRPPPGDRVPEHPRGAPHRAAHARGDGPRGPGRRRIRRVSSDWWSSATTGLSAPTSVGARAT